MLGKELRRLEENESKEKRELNLLRASLANKENEVNSREASLRRREAELEMQLLALEPSLRSAEVERLVEKILLSFVTQIMLK